MSFLENSIRATMVVALQAEGKTEQEALTLADDNLATCVSDTQADYTANVAEFVEAGHPQALAERLAATQIQATVWQWAQNNL
jgi:hypothetical protein